MAAVTTLAVVALLMMAVISAPPTQANRLAERIVGGELVPDGYAPWMVSLQTVADGKHFCGGTLIGDPNDDDILWVLTAAHCVKGRVPSTVAALAGTHTLASPSYYAQSRTVCEIIPHPSYNPDTLDYDIAKLRLCSPLLFSYYVIETAPLLPASMNQASLVGRQATVVGWGRDESGTPSDVLKWVQLPIVANPVCQAALGAAVTITPRMVCAGGLYNQDASQGDSGGPLLVEDLDTAGPLYFAGRMYLTAVASNGLESGVTGIPGVYSFVNAVRAWIESDLP